MSSHEGVARAIAEAQDWNERVSRIRQVPEAFGTGKLALVYAAIAREVYVPALSPDFAYVHWREDYELAGLEAAYRSAHDGTAGFTSVEEPALVAVIRADPSTVRVFRLLLGFTTQEFAAATDLVSVEFELPSLTNGRVKAMEAGAPARDSEAAVAAKLVALVMAGELFSKPRAGMRRKADRPDTARGWATVAGYAADGVPLPVFLHLRHYGGAFRQLLDATSTRRGDVLEDAVQEIFEEHGIPFMRTGSANQEEIARRFGLTVRPAPDFVVHDGRSTLRAMLECKVANDGGTARDKAARFRALRTEATRLGGVPLFAVLSGLGWTRTNDALGPVVAATDGRVFTLETLDDLITVQPLPDVRG
jgi:hypothetical protein